MVKITKEKGFKQIHMTLETQAEADVVWCALNAPENVTMKEAKKSINEKRAEKMGGMISDIWDKLNNVHDPTKDKED